MEMLVIGIVAIAAFAAVLFPLFRRRPGYGDEAEFENIPPARPASHAAGTETERPGPAGAVSSAPEPKDGAGADAIEAEVLRYRAAVRAGTVCRKCGQANPAESVYCHECGGRLPLADAKEFE